MVDDQEYTPTFRRSGQPKSGSKIVVILIFLAVIAFTIFMSIPKG